MKKTNTKIIFLLLITTFITLIGCQKKEEEVISFYKNGKYQPEDSNYEITLPNENWIIEGKENSKNITFAYNKNTIHIERIKKSEIKEIIKEIPKSQEELEKNFKRENTTSNVINAFQSDVFYEENKNYSTVKYNYLNTENSKISIFYSVYNDDFLYQITGNTKDNNISENIKAAIETFKIVDENIKTNVFQIKEKEIKGNLYTSQQNTYTLTLPYKNWKFETSDQFAEEINTIISTENLSIKIETVNINSQVNTIIYEIPRDKETLDKQITEKKLGEYQILDFKVKTVGALEDFNQDQKYTWLHYLLKLSNNQYYAYYEYRGESNTYKLTGTLAIDDLEKAQELNNILCSFQLK